jgi:hypothetical protein
MAHGVFPLSLPFRGKGIKYYEGASWVSSQLMAEQDKSKNLEITLVGQKCPEGAASDKVACTSILSEGCYATSDLH